MTMAILEDAGYEHYEISNYARPGFESVHNRAYWLGKDYLGIGPSAVSTIGMQRWQNVCDYRAYIDRVLSDQSPCESIENLTDEMKRTERIALSLRTRDGISASELKDFAQTDELIALGLLRESNENFMLTPKGKALADSIAEALLYVPRGSGRRGDLAIAAIAIANFLLVAVPASVRPTMLLLSASVLRT